MLNQTSDVNHEMCRMWEAYTKCPFFLRGAFSTRQSKQIAQTKRTWTMSTPRPFWTDLSKTLSSRFWLPTKTACASSDTNSCTAWSRSIVSPSWSSVKVWKPDALNTDSSLPQSEPKGLTDFFQEPLVETSATQIRSKKVKLRLTPMKIGRASCRERV